MIEKTYVDLINKEIDGVNSQEDSDKLKSYLAENPEAQDLYNDLLSVSSMLDKIDQIEPSPTLRRDILESLPQKKYATKEKKDPLEGTGNVLKSLLPFQTVKFNFRYAYAFSAGLILGITILFLFVDKIYQKTDLDISDLYGTMMHPGTSESLETADHAEINLDQVQGEIHLKYSEEIVLAELDLNTEREIEIVFEFDEHDISFNSFARLNNNENNLNIGKNRLRLSNIGDNKYIIIFHDKTESITPMNVKIFSSGDLLYERDISTGPTTNF